MVILKGAVIFFAFIAMMVLILYVVIVATEEDDTEPMTLDEIAEERSRYACYEDGGDIDG